MKKQQWVKRFDLFVMLIAALAISTMPAMAGDAKLYPGSMGVRYAGTATPVLNFSAIGNPGSTWLYLDLPIINDNFAGIKAGWVRAIDMHSTADVTCSLNSAYRSGNSYVGWWSPQKRTSGIASWAQTLTFPAVGGNGSSHYYYSCKIPPKSTGGTSYIVSYQADER
jgi:hypothetical protein